MSEVIHSLQSIIASVNYIK